MEGPGRPNSGLTCFHSKFIVIVLCYVVYNGHKPI